MKDETNFRALVEQRRWSAQAFSAVWRRACQELDETPGAPAVGEVPLSERTFQRWMLGGLGTMPRGDYRCVLEHLFGMSAEELFGPVTPGADQGQARAGEPTA
ncbi:hypothetical protein [Streptacidiphilus sp. EB103A]|uniref:hypothetical protein n=1 Tax=Streptacidiphilus sp. EB103A TaxID=3156275 RepID=UPI003512F448